MAAIKSLSRISEKWADNAGSTQAGNAYREGVQSPRRSWEDATVAADDARKAGLEAADARDAFITGVREAGNAKWQRRATSLGPSRFRQGVREAKDDFSRGFAPFHSVIAGLTLPPRGPKGSPENIERVRVIAEALHAERVGS